MNKASEDNKKELHQILTSFEQNRISAEESFILILKKFKKSSDLEYFFSSISTPKEIETFLRRMLVIKKLKEEKSQHQIVSELKVGVTTVTRGAKEIRKNKFNFI